MQVSKATRAELEGFARAQYRERFAEQAPAQVRNAMPLMALGEARPLRYRSMGYVVPPLSFRAGVRLMTVLHGIEQAPESGVALKTARRLLYSVVRTRRGRRPWLNPFRRIDGSSAARLISELLHVPGDTPTLPISRRSIDLLDGLMEFMRMYPALVGADGLPLTWAHYQHGLRHMGKSHARDALRFAQAMRVAQCGKDTWQQYATEQRSVAGWE